MIRWSAVKPLLPATLPSMGVIAILLCFFGYSRLLQGSSATYILPEITAGPGVPPQLPVAEFQARLFWGAGSAALVLTLLWNIVLSSYVLETVLRGEGYRRAHSRLWSMTFITVAISSIVLYFMPTSGGAGRLLLESIDRQSGVPVWHFTTFTNIFTGIGVIFVVSAATALLLPVGGDGEIRLVRLRRRIQLSKLGLYSASGLLAVGVFQLWALYTWPASFLEHSAARPIRLMGSSITFAAGALFTGCLIFIFLPTAVVHQAWVSAQVYEASTGQKDFDPNEWLRKQGLDTPTLTLFNRAMVIFAPMATAGMTHFIG
jgi:hypothetical protein